MYGLLNAAHPLPLEFKCPLNPYFIAFFEKIVLVLDVIKI
jgi:hypothetical protein